MNSRSKTTTMARARSARGGRRPSTLAAFLDKVLSDGVDIDKLLANPGALAEVSGFKLTKAEKAQLAELPLADTLDQLYAGLGGADRRFLMAKRKPLGEASIPPTMIIPLVGVVVAVGVAAVVIKSVPRAKVTDRSLRAGQKL